MVLFLAGFYGVFFGRLLWCFFRQALLVFFGRLSWCFFWQAPMVLFLAGSHGAFAFVVSFPIQFWTLRFESERLLKFNFVLPNSFQLPEYQMVCGGLYMILQWNWYLPTCENVHGATPLWVVGLSKQASSPNIHRREQCPAGRVFNIGSSRVGYWTKYRVAGRV